MRRTGAIQTFTNPRKFSGINKNPSGDIPGQVSTFSSGSSATDNFENIMEIQTACFNDIQSGADLNLVDFSKLITLLNELDPRYDSMKNFLLDTLTIVNMARTYFNKAINLAEQIEILQDEYDELLKDYNWLKEHCGELKEDKEIETSLKFCTKVEVDMNMVYILYQHFFGYPSDGIWDEEKANMIRRHIQKKQITNLSADGSIIKIRYIETPVKIELQPAPSAVLEIKLGHPTSIGDDTILTNILEAYGATEINYGLKIGQEIIIDYGGEHPETRICIGFGSIILNKPLEFPHLPGSIIMIAAQGGTKYLPGKIIKTNDNFESYDIQLDIGGVVKEVRENVIEDGKIVDPRSDCNTLDNDNTEYICQMCGGDSCGCKCETCGIVINNCNCNK